MSPGTHNRDRAGPTASHGPEAGHSAAFARDPLLLSRELAQALACPLLQRVDEQASECRDDKECLIELDERFWNRHTATSELFCIYT